MEAALQFGVQDDAGNSSSYAASLFFDAEIERIHVAGSVYSDDNQRSCFMGSLQLPQIDNIRGPTWVRREAYGGRNASMACASVFMAKYQGIRTYFLLGYSDTYPDFLPNAKGSISGSPPDIYGITMELNFAGTLYGGLVTQSDRMQFPIAIIGNSTNGTGLFVATAHTTTPYSGSSYQRFLESQKSGQPDPDVTGAFLPPRFEKGCSVTLSGLEQTQVNENIEDPSSSNSSSQSQYYSNLQRTWTKELRTREGDSVFLTQMLKHPRGDLLLAGYTAGTGSDYGSVTKDGSIDSFVTSLSPSTGKTLKSMRLQSASNSTDLILGMCARELNSSAFYIVGMTNEHTVVGQESNSSAPNSSTPTSFKAFVLKLDLDTFALLWTTEIKGIPALTGGNGDVMALSCAVTRDNAVVYVGGTVKNGASLSLDGQSASTNSSGGDDIFVAKMRVDNGTVAFIRQIGTEHDDRMAYGNSLVTDNQGNALVLGNTKGSLFRRKSTATEGNITDFVVFSVDRFTGGFSGVYANATNTEFNETDRSNVTGRSNVTFRSNVTDHSNVTEPTESHEETNTPAMSNSTATPASPTIYRHSTDPPTLRRPSHPPTRNVTSGLTEKGNMTDTATTNVTQNSTDANVTTSEPDQPIGSPPTNDSILIASIATLVGIICFSCVSLGFIKYKRRRDKKVTQSVWDAEEESQNTGVYTSPKGRKNGHGRRSGAKGHEGGSLDSRSYVSGDTIRSIPPLRDPQDADTRLRLDPSFRTEPADIENKESTLAGHRPTHHHPPTAELSSVRRSSLKPSASGTVGSRVSFDIGTEGGNRRSAAGSSSLGSLPSHDRGDRRHRRLPSSLSSGASLDDSVDDSSSCGSLDSDSLLLAVTTVHDTGTGRRTYCDDSTLASSSTLPDEEDHLSRAEYGGGRDGGRDGGRGVRSDPSGTSRGSRTVGSHGTASHSTGSRGMFS